MMNKGEKQQKDAAAAPRKVQEAEVVTARPALATVPAAWPTGTLMLAIAGVLPHCREAAR